ncbi:MAG TPA: mechanosensitive ion channel family protein [Bacteroidota bacterium]|jgi:small-conductance mechanosensitive channel
MLEDLFVKHLIFAGLIIAAAGLVGKLVELIWGRLARRLSGTTRTTLDDKLLELVRKRLAMLSLIAGVYIAIREVRQGLNAENVTRHQILDYVEIALFVFLVVILTRLVSRIIRASFDWYLEDVAAKTHSEIVPSVAPLTAKIVNIVLFLIAGMILLDHFGVNMGSLFVSLGVGSLAVALAAQETIANMIAGFVILIDQPFRIGDHIKLPTGEEGDVHQIGLRSTRMLNPERNLMIIPNGELIKSRIINYSFPDSAMTVTVDVTVSPSTGPERVREILTALAAGRSDIQQEPPPRVVVMGSGESGIQMRLICTTFSFRKRFEIETGLREQILASFAKEGIELPVPRRLIQVIDPHEAQAPQTH